MDDAPALALDPEAFRALGYQAVDLAAAHLAGMRDAPVFRPMSPAARQTLLEQPLPEAGVAPEEILARFAADVLPYPMGNGHPRFFGWVNSPPAPMGILAELLAAAMGPSCAGGDHAASYLERAATRWLMELVGFPVAGSVGLLVSGGSMASLTGLAAARQRAAREDGWDVRERGLDDWGQRLTLYLSSEAHTTLRKAAELLGLGAESVRTVPVRADFRLDMAALREAIAADRSAGLRPFCVVGSAGTVSTGAIDPLTEIADLCAAEGLWFHVDGAYGAAGVLDPLVAPAYAGMERADSLALDPHKWFSVPVECGCALVRDGALLRDAFSMVPPYLRTEEGKGFGGLPWFAEYGFQQTRGFRALKLWMTLLHAGRAGLTDMISRQNALARSLAELVDAAPDLELLSEVTLSICCFRFVPPGRALDDAALDALNKQLMEEVQAGGAAFLTQAMIHGRFALRANVLHYATTAEDIRALVEVVRETGAALSPGT
ncbi:MAG: aminotransferase class V-fold PLP-dependent enzyme [Thermomicrobiales bacterium]|nr:aminotransferase class V-fold PLP-dependent enzyme [Thermomicrobiales bacterium]